MTTNPLYKHIYKTVDNMRKGVHRLSDELMTRRELGDAADNYYETESELNEMSSDSVASQPPKGQIIISTFEQLTSSKDDDPVVASNSEAALEISAFTEATNKPTHDKIEVAALGIDRDTIENVIATKRRIKALKKELEKEEKLLYDY